MPRSATPSASVFDLEQLLPSPSRDVPLPGLLWQARRLHQRTHGASERELLELWNIGLAKPTPYLQSVPPEDARLMAVAWTTADGDANLWYLRHAPGDVSRAWRTFAAIAASLHLRILGHSTPASWIQVATFVERGQLLHIVEQRPFPGYLPREGRAPYELWRAPRARGSGAS